jgi:protein ImuA
MLSLQPARIGLSNPSHTGNGRTLNELRLTIARMQAPAVALDAPGEIPLGIPEIDHTLGGGLVCGALHEIAACGEAHIAAATGFALGVAALRRVKPAVVWVVEDMALIESGAPYGPGLDLHGLAPERMLTVAGVKVGDVLWAMEEALHCRAVGVVIGEVRSTSREIDLVATRRLSLAAATHGAIALLLRTSPGNGASAAATRWVVGAASAFPSPERRGSEIRRGSGVGSHGIGPPRFDLALTRNRRGPLSSWVLEWSVSDVSFVLATHPEPMARISVDRPDTRAA